MPLRTPFILADVDIAKVVIGVLVFVVWGISSLASMVKKANEEAKRRALSRAAGVTPAPNILANGGMAATPVPRPPPRPKAAPKKLQVRPALKAVAQPVRPPPAPVAKPKPVAAPEFSVPVVEKSALGSISNVARSKSVGAKAPAIRKWLTPETLRKQFILTELFRPPVALRDGQEG